MSLVGTTLGGRYQLVGVLGTGGMGAVYEAMQLDLKRRVAVKVMHEWKADSTDFARFRHEAEAAASLGHPNIVHIIDFEANEGEPPFMVMELLKGTSLGALVRQHRRLVPNRAVSIGVQLLSALGAAHDARIIHRDVKPENVFVCNTSPLFELVKVLDFGLARPLDEQRKWAQTAAGFVVGTPAYMSPEQARGGQADARMDLFAAGACLYYALAGRRPFEGPTTSALMAAIRKMPPIPLASACPDLDLNLVRVVERSLAKHPEERFASARDFIEALRPFAQGRLSAPPSSGQPAPPPRVETAPQGRQAGRRRQSGELASVPPASAPAELAPGITLRVLSPRIGDGIVRVGRFSPSGNGAMAVGPTGLAKWANGAWAGRPLIPGWKPELVRTFGFAPSGETLIVGIDGNAYWRDPRQYTLLAVGADLALMDAWVDDLTSVTFAAVVMPGSKTVSRSIAHAGLQSGDSVLVSWTPDAMRAHPLTRNMTVLGVTRTASAQGRGPLVACGERGSLYLLDASGAVHARTVAHASLTHVAPRPDGGVVAVGRAGTVVVLDQATPQALAAATAVSLGPWTQEDLVASATAPDGTTWVAARTCLFCGRGAALSRVASGGSISAPIAAVWAAGGRARLLLENASVVEVELAKPGI